MLQRTSKEDLDIASNQDVENAIANNTPENLVPYMQAEIDKDLGKVLLLALFIAHTSNSIELFDEIAGEKIPILRDPEKRKTFIKHVIERSPLETIAQAAEISTEELTHIFRQIIEKVLVQVSSIPDTTFISPSPQKIAGSIYSTAILLSEEIATMENSDSALKIAYDGLNDRCFNADEMFEKRNFQPPQEKKTVENPNISKSTLEALIQNFTRSQIIRVLGSVGITSAKLKKQSRNRYSQPGVPVQLTQKSLAKPGEEYEEIDLSDGLINEKLLRHLLAEALKSGPETLAKIARKTLLLVASVMAYEEITNTDEPDVDLRQQKRDNRSFQLHQELIEKSLTDPKEFDLTIKALIESGKW